MAKVYSGLLGHVSGSIGNHVFYRMNGKQYVRSKAAKVKVSQSEACVANRAKFAMAGKLVKSLRPLLSLSYLPAPRRISVMNLALREVYKNALVGSYPEFKIDYSKVLVSKGYLLPAVNARALVLSDWVFFDWEYVDGRFVSPGDRALFVVYCEALQRCAFVVSDVERRDFKGNLSVLQFKGHTVQTWLGFMGADGKAASSSVYTGSLFIA